ncbi:alpha/beta fold hydrolase [Streptomyces montanisoli]|uniref:Alpha/beta hydrolase n=1 Tax=Streptomyces montanisoli TaxID=2798581 RepID=A0A940M9I3_9ACTN|nr:alpha/beta fold hydrolase [Streptomyces montanisoli]MBP0458774.1 alpha/beta hydrolase [Streptomyces montanisoli]
MERYVEAADGARLWVEAFGRACDPAVLLVMGGGAQGIVWPDELCVLLATAGHYVVRYDHRDTGLSARSAVGYGMPELAADAAAVITGLGLAGAHVVGQSMGGMVAQLLALDHPGLVRSLTLLSSSPDANGDACRPPVSGLPGPRAPMLDHVARLRAVPPSTAEEECAAAVDGWRVLLGPSVPFDRAYWEGLVARARERDTRPDTAGRHTAALDRMPPLTERIRSLDVLALVVHGEEDPVFPLEHGTALHRALPHSRLRRIAGMGHLFPPHWSPILGELITDHVLRVRPGNAGGSQ